LGELRGVRERLLAFLEETERRDLSGYRWPHAFLGMLNVYEWFELVAAHQLRHSKQVRKIFSRLPKVVEVSRQGYIFAYQPVKTDSGVDFEINTKKAQNPLKMGRNKKY